MHAAGILASALLAGLYVRGGAAWVLGFVLLVPWLRTLDATCSLGGALLGGLAMAVAYTAAGFGWFGHAIGRFTGAGDAVGLAVLLLGAPLLQPQFVVFALVRHAVGRWRGPLLAALAGSAAWVATESLWPKLLGDTLGHGLYPSALMRQGAVLGGAAGLTMLLLLANESLAAAWRRRRHGRWPAARQCGVRFHPVSGAGCISLPFGHAHRGKRGISGGRDRRHELYSGWGLERLEVGRSRNDRRSRAADRHHAAGTARGRRSGRAWSCAWLPRTSEPKFAHCRMMPVHSISGVRRAPWE